MDLQKHLSCMQNNDFVNKPGTIGHPLGEEIAIGLPMKTE